MQSCCLPPPVCVGLSLSLPPTQRRHGTGGPTVAAEHEVAVEGVALEAGVGEAAEAGGGGVASGQTRDLLAFKEAAELLIRRLDLDEREVEILITLGLVALVLVCEKHGRR